MDYFAIGQRIRKARKARGLSQEALAERVEISVTHMSHIETGNTKLSLAVLVDLAIALDVSTDELLFDNQVNSKTAANEKIHAILETCSASQSQIIADIVAATKRTLDIHS
ncbi:MAG: helix-turn-helix transcriptional regulator [Ruminococcaceae bacterium]|nr:helix-turn-helix transcriptional regulator [Oscillospiraceae bacterium]